MPETPAEPVDEGEAIDQPHTPNKENARSPHKEQMRSPYKETPCSPRSPRQSLGFFQPRPIVVFITGGAWIIGYKAWSLMMGRVFQANGVVLVSPDYRNFPQGTAKSMVEDVTAAIR
jgi:acetyl esterase/lipase